MHRIDRQLFSVMVTIEIHLKLCRREPFRHVSELGKYISDMMVRFKKQGTIDKRVFRYYRESLAPQTSGFAQRWGSRLRRYLEIDAVDRSLAGLSDIERISKAMDTIAADMNIVVKRGVMDEIEFDKDESKQVAEFGFIALASKEEQERISDDGQIKETCCLSARLPDQERIVAVYQLLQTFGFSLYQPETTVQPRKVGFISLLSPGIGKSRAPAKAA